MICPVTILQNGSAAHATSAAYKGAKRKHACEEQGEVNDERKNAERADMRVFHDGENAAAVFPATAKPIEKVG